MHISFPDWIERNKWKLLLVAMIAMMIISPVTNVYDDQDNIISPLVGSVLLAVGLGTVERARTGWLLTLLTVVWVIIAHATDGSGIFATQTQLAPALFLVILAGIFVLLARWLIRVAHINAEVLCAAICGYLIIGMVWAGIYAFMNLNYPQAWSSADNATITPRELLYFSYTTLTTTGFGDILPHNPEVRMLTVMEAIVGTFYNTIVIARFVGLYGLKMRPDTNQER